MIFDKLQAFIIGYKVEDILPANKREITRKILILFLFSGISRLFAGKKLISAPSSTPIILLRINSKSTSKFSQILIFYCGESPNLPDMQTTFFGGQGILPEMPAALHLESGILGKRRLSDRDDSSAARLAVFILVFLLCRNFFALNFQPNSPQSRQPLPKRPIFA